LLVATVAVSLTTGAYAIPIADVVRVLSGGADGTDAATVLWNIRVPRVVAGLLTGAALAAAGAAYQGMFRNPLVSPDILGVSAGAGFGALLGIYLRLPAMLVQALAFAGGLISVSLVMTIGSRVRRHDPALVLVLAGVAMGTLLGAGMSMLKILADPYTQLPTMTYWLLGSFAGVTAGDAYGALPLVALGLVPLALLRWRLNVQRRGMG
jgi:iron complex transport system permease protein